MNAWPDAVEFRPRLSCHRSKAPSDYRRYLSSKRSTPG